MPEAAELHALELECKVQTEPEAYDACAVVRHLAHELRQPLSAMESIAYYLCLVVSRNDEKAQAQLGKLDLLVDQMEWVLSDAVNFLQAAPCRPQIVDFFELADSAAAGCRQEGFRVEHDDGPALVTLDPGQAKHLLSSLFRLASQLARGFAGISAAAWTADGKVTLVTQVPGMDVDQQRLAEMCEPFTPHLPSGSGLALASASRIVESHGGSFHARVQPGLGTELQVSFPLA